MSRQLDLLRDPEALSLTVSKYPFAKSPKRDANREAQELLGSFQVFRPSEDRYLGKELLVVPSHLGCLGCVFSLLLQQVLVSFLV